MCAPVDQAVRSNIPTNLFWSKTIGASPVPSGKERLGMRRGNLKIESGRDLLFNHYKQSAPNNRPTVDCAMSKPGPSQLSHSSCIWLFSKVARVWILGPKCTQKLDSVHVRSDCVTHFHPALTRTELESGQTELWSGQAGP